MSHHISMYLKIIYDFIIFFRVPLFQMKSVVATVDVPHLVNAFRK